MKIVQVTDSGNATLVTISGDGRYIVYVLAEGEKQSLWVRQVATGSDVPLLAPDLVNFRAVSMSPDNNYVHFIRSDKSNVNYSYLFSMPVLGGNPKQLGRDIDTAPVWSPDGKKLAYLRGVPNELRMDILTANPDGSDEKLLAKLESVSVNVRPISWSPDGKWIAATVIRFLGDRVTFSLLLVSTKDRNVREFFQSDTPLGSVRWTPDGKGMLLIRGDMASKRSQLYFLSYPDPKLTRLINDLSNYSGDSLDVTQDGRTIATIQNTIQDSLWLAPTGAARSATQLSAREELSGAITWLDSTRLALPTSGRILAIDLTGKKSTIAANETFFQSAVPCGNRLLLNNVDKNLKLNIMESDLLGGNMRLLRSGAATACSPDGSWYLYGGAQTDIIRSSFLDGAERVLASRTGAAGGASVSPDGGRILYGYQSNDKAVISYFAGVASSGGGPQLLSFKLPIGARQLRWSKKGDSFYYSMTRDGAGNIWEQPLSGGPAHQVTHFPPGHDVFSYAWSPDFQQLAVAQRQETNNVVLLRDFR